MEILSSLTIFTGIICCLCTVIYHLRRSRLYKAAGQFPGPPALPILGNALNFIGKKDKNIDTLAETLGSILPEVIFDVTPFLRGGNTVTCRKEGMLQGVMNLATQYPSPSRLWLGNQLWFVVNDPHQFESIINSSKLIDKDAVYDFFKPVLGEGLITASGPKWKVLRKLINPSFNTKMIESFIPIIAAQSQGLVKKMESEVSGGEFDIFQYFALCLADIMCETVIGLEMNVQNSLSEQLVETMKRLTAITFERIFQVWLHPDFIFSRSKGGIELNERMAFSNGVLNDAIQKRKDEFARQRSEGDTEDDRSPRNKSLMNIMWGKTGDCQISDVNIRDQVITFLGAGTDTCASINSFLLLMFAMHPEIQDKVYAELCDIYGYDDSEDRPVAYEDLHRMKYLERVIKETMRIFTPAPLLARRVSEDFQLGEYTFPKGSSVVLSIMSMHRNERYWPNPLKFDPDRFLPEESAKRHPYCYLPFSGGPRNCIGKVFAMLLMKTMLATILRRFIIKKDDIVPIEDIELEQKVVLEPLKPITIRIENRTANKST